MRRRLDLASALIGRPQLLFLDEPTTGLDPRSRLGMWEVIRDLVRSGATLLLTTQYLEEADALANVVAVVDHGKIIARGTADEFKSQVGGERVEVVVRKNDDLQPARDVLARACVADVATDAHTRRLTAPADGGTQQLVSVIRALDDAGIPLDDVGLRRPTLDDVFLSLTGHAAEETPGRERQRATGSATQGQGREGIVSTSVESAPLRTPRSRSGSTFSDTVVVTWRNLKRIPRIPELAAFAILQSVMFVLLFAYVFGGAIPLPDGGDYKEFLMPGIFAQTLAFASATTTVGITDDMQKGLVDRFRSLPMARSAFLTGRTVADVVYNLGILIVLMLTGLVVGWRVNNGVVEFPDRDRAGPALHLRDVMAGRLRRPAGANRRGGAAGGVHDDLSDYLPVQRLRPHRDAADLAATGRRVESGDHVDRLDARAVRQSESVPRRRLSGRAPDPGHGRLVHRVRGGVRPAGGPAIPRHLPLTRSSAAKYRRSPPFTHREMLCCPICQHFRSRTVSEVGAGVGSVG